MSHIILNNTAHSLLKHLFVVYKHVKLCAYIPNTFIVLTAYIC